MTSDTILKIGFVLDDGLDKPDGVQQNILTLGGWLKSQGHEVTYIVGETNRRDIENLIPLSKNLKVSFNGNRLSIPLYSSSKKINSVLKTNDFDVVHVQVPYSPLMAGRLIARLPKKTALVGTFHILPAGLASRWGSKLLGRVLARNLKRFDKHLAVSVPAKVFARQSFGIGCEILPNPVNISQYRPAKPEINAGKTVRLVFLGRLVSRKGCAHLLEAANYILKNNLASNGFHIDICGSGPLEAELRKYAKKNNLDKHIKFHGFVSEEEKINFLRQADISLFPSLSGESFGIVLVEAMAAAGGIVIAGDNPGYRSILQSMPESLINPREIRKFAEKIAYFIESQKDRDLLQAKQQAIVEQFDVNRVGSKLLNIYKDCISFKKSR